MNINTFEIIAVAPQVVIILFLSGGRGVEMILDTTSARVLVSKDKLHEVIVSETTDLRACLCGGRIYLA